jgi:hypothetical protein
LSRLDLAACEAMCKFTTGAMLQVKSRDHLPLHASYDITFAQALVLMTVNASVTTEEPGTCASCSAQVHMWHVWRVACDICHLLPSHPIMYSSGSTCSLHGTCSITSSSATSISSPAKAACVCNSGWGGEQCDLECPGGALNPCNGNGRCLADGRCDCSEG